jgi:BA14K-like protein
MFSKTKIVVAATLMLGIASAARAAGDEINGGFRELASGAVVNDGINPVYHRSLAGSTLAACESRYKSSFDPVTLTYVGRDGKHHPCE